MESKKLSFPYTPISSVAERFHASSARYVALVGGFRSGKTTAACAEIIARLIESPGNVAAICRKTFGELDRSTRVVFQSLLIPEIVQRGYSQGDHTIFFVNGSRALFFPLDEPEKIKSLTLGCFLVDEASEIDEDMFLFLKGRLSLVGVDHKGIVVSNPTTTHHWLYKYFGSNQFPNHQCFHLSTYDNKFLPPEYLKDLEEGYSEEMKARFLRGEWGFPPVGERVFSEFSRSLHVRPLRYHPNRPLILGWDFGYVHPAVVFTQIDDQDRLLVLKELMGRRETIEVFGRRVLQVINREFPNPISIENYGDPHGESTPSGGQTDRSAIKILRDELNIHVYTKVASKAERLELVRRKLNQNIGGQTAIQFDESHCPILIEGLSGGYVCKKSREGIILKDEPLEDGYYEHLQDALQFIILNKFGGDLKIKRVSKSLPFYRPMWEGTSY